MNDEEWDKGTRESQADIAAGRTCTFDNPKAAKEWLMNDEVERVSTLDEEHNPLLAEFWLDDDDMV